MAKQEIFENKNHLESFIKAANFSMNDKQVELMIAKHKVFELCEDFPYRTNPGYVAEKLNNVDDTLFHFEYDNHFNTGFMSDDIKLREAMEDVDKFLFDAVFYKWDRENLEWVKKTPARVDIQLPSLSWLD